MYRILHLALLLQECPYHKLSIGSILIISNCLLYSISTSLSLSSAIFIASCSAFFEVQYDGLINFQSI